MPACIRSAALLALAMLAQPCKAACTLSKIIDLPVTMRGTKAHLDVRIDGHDVALIVDSGAFFSMISPGAAAELALPRRDAPMGFYVSGVGGTTEPTIGTVKDFTVSGITLHKLEFLVGGSEFGAAGLLGQNILGFRDAEYDLGGGMVRLMDARNCERANLAYWTKDKPVTVVPLIEPQRAGDKHVIATVQVNGVPMRATFDTGAAGTVITTAAAARAGVRVNGPGVIATERSAGIGRHTVQSWIGQFRVVDVGGEQIRNTELRITKADNADWDMLIGADFFLSHHVYVANRDRRMFITYNGGPVFRLPNLHDPDDEDGAAPTSLGAHAAIAAADAATEPSDADGFARRGAAREGRRDLAGALADLDRAVKLAPEEPRYLAQRGGLHMLLRQPLLAASDLDAAIRLRPDDVESHLLRAVLRMRANDRDGAREDVDAANKTAAKQADARLRIASLYSQLDRPDEAIDDFDLWIAAHPDDYRKPSALNGRCWARALANKALPQALADCDAALRRASNEPSFLDSRGLVHLRMGDRAKAIADYDRALAGNPTLAFSLWGRGLAKLGEGDAAGGKADLAAAAAADPKLPARARHYGLVPPG